MVGSLDRPLTSQVAEPAYDLRRQCSIAATSPAGRRAFARMWRAVRASGRDAMGDHVASAFGRTPLAGKMGSAARPRRKFSALQSVENSQNAERISILREALAWAGGTPGAKEEGATCGQRGSRAARSRLGSRVGGDPEPIVDLLNRGDPVAGSRRERLTATRSRPEMAPQRLEKIESAPRNGRGSEASKLQDVVLGRAADRARPRPTSREKTKLQRKIFLPATL
jgi:hypothetical protein